MSACAVARVWRRGELCERGIRLRRASEDGHRVKWTLGILVLAAGVFLLHALHFRAYFHGYAVDDAYISFRYARNLLDGHGLVFNPGDRIEGYSNFLWVLAMAPFMRAGGNPALWAQLIAVACSVATLILVDHALTRMFSVQDRALRLFALLLLSGSGYFAGWSISGLETNAFALLLLAAWVRLLVEALAPTPRWPLSALLLVVLALLRPEGVFLALGAVIARVWVRRRRLGRVESWRRLAVFALIVCVALMAYELWRCGYYGPHWLSNSVRAKVGGGLQQFLSGLRYVWRFFLIPYLPLLLAFLFAYGRWRGAGTTPSAMPDASPARGAAALVAGSGVVLSLGYLLFVAAVGGDWSYGRLFVPVLPVTVVTAVGLAGSSPRFARWTGTPRRRLVLGILALGYLGWAWEVTSRQREAARWEAWWKVDSERITMGKTFAEIMPKDAVVAVYAAGQIPYFSGLRAHDMLGLNDAYIGGLSMPGMGHGVPGHEKWNARYTLEVVKPDIIVEGRLIPGLEDHPLRRRDYHRIEGFSKYQEVFFHRRIVEYLQSTGKLPQNRR